MLNLIFFSNYSKNTQRFVESLNWTGGEVFQIPVQVDTRSFEDAPVDQPYILITPSYGTIGQGRVPAQVKKFLSEEVRRESMAAVIGTGNMNFGDEYCMAATVIGAKFNKPVIAKIELAGTPQDVTNTRDLLLRIKAHFEQEEM